MFLPREPLIEILHLDDHGLFFHSDLWYHILFRRSCTCFCGTDLTGGLLIALLDWYVYSYPLITGNFQLNHICLLTYLTCISCIEIYLFQLLETWLTYIQPWRYVNSRSKLGRRDSDVNDTKTVEEKWLVPRMLQQFIHFVGNCRYLVWRVYRLNKGDKGLPHMYMCIYSLQYCHHVNMYLVSAIFQF